MGSTSFLGFSYPNLLLVFLKLLFFGTYFCRKCWDFLWVFLYLFYRYFSVVVDSHIQRIVLATEETTVTQQVSHTPIK